MDEDASVEDEDEMAEEPSQSGSDVDEVMAPIQTAEFQNAARNIRHVTRTQAEMQCDEQDETGLGMDRGCAVVCPGGGTHVLVGDATMSDVGCVARRSPVSLSLASAADIMGIEVGIPAAVVADGAIAEELGEVENGMRLGNDLEEDAVNDLDAISGGESDDILDETGKSIFDDTRFIIRPPSAVHGMYFNYPHVSYSSLCDYWCTGRNCDAGRGPVQGIGDCGTACGGIVCC